MRSRTAVLFVLALGPILSAATPVRGFIINSAAPDPWLSTASGPRSGNGAPATLTWSIVPDGTATTRLSGIGTSPSNLIAFMNSNFGGNPAQMDLTQQPWFHLFDESFGRWEQLGGVNYVYESHDDGVMHPGADGVLGVRGDIRISGIAMDGASGTLAFTYLPEAGSDMAFDTGEASFFSNSASNYRNLRDTTMHEIGHGFGMQHVNSTSDLLMEPIINTSFDGPQLDEVRGIQFFFGDVNEKSNGGLGNGTAALATSLGTIAGGATKSVGAAANVAGQAISPSATDFVSIANLADTDYYSFTVSQTSLLSAVLTPRGGVFFQAADGQTQTSFNANARNNLTLTLFSTNAASTLSTANASPAGAAESITDQFLSGPGTYYARISGADDTVQLYDLSLSIVPLATGDYNRNGVVDAADYTVWRNTRGQTGVALAADGNANQQIDIGDFAVWKSHYGETVGTGGSLARSTTAEPPVPTAAVPEPASAALICFGFAFLFVGHGCRRRRDFRSLSAR
jgi:hypothetical protein